MSVIDETHDARREKLGRFGSGPCRVSDSELALRIFNPAGGAPRGGAPIGDAIFDLSAGLEAGLFSGEAARAAEAAAGAALNH